MKTSFSFNRFLCVRQSTQRVEESGLALSNSLNNFTHTNLNYSAFDVKYGQYFFTCNRYLLLKY